jgi:hypothetical protein
MTKRHVPAIKIMLYFLKADMSLLVDTQLRVIWILGYHNC